MRGDEGELSCCEGSVVAPLYPKMDLLHDTDASCATIVPLLYVACGRLFRLGARSKGWLAGVNCPPYFDQSEELRHIQAIAAAITFAPNRRPSGCEFRWFSGCWCNVQA